ncbi:MAG TPA: 3-deoxy-D-manno-octulosonate 8-phosphate phosphatase [Chitinophagaceae bacterium]|nr:3-deoxy-D-manno-octulosonate 8-phosphate phosphatase [Chitinophagaceae bacterium]
MNLLEYFKPVTTLVFDIDGVLTDGNILVFETGEQVRRMNIKDGYALQLAVKKKYNLVVVSGGNGVGAGIRLRKLGITNIFLNVTSKTEVLDDYLRQHQLSWAETLYMGDDIPDYRPMQKAGMPCAPADAAPEILQAARYISPYGGGKGCVRDVIEKLLRLHGHWEMDSGIASR